MSDREEWLSMGKLLGFFTVSGSGLGSRVFWVFLGILGLEVVPVIFVEQGLEVQS